MRRNIHRAALVGLVGLLAGGGIVGAADLAVGTNLTLAATVDLAIRDNAELKSLRAKWEAMLEKPALAAALPNPMLSYGGMDMASGGSWPDTSEKRVMVQQEFSWRGKRGLREGMAVKDAETMQRELESMTRDVVMTVKETYYNLYAVQRVISITRAEDAVVRSIETVAETLYATGASSQADVLKAQTETTMLKQKLLEAQALENTLKATLNKLIHRRADSPLGEVVLPPETEFPGNIEALFALAAANHPEIKAAQAQTERYELEKQLMAKESLPDYRIGLEYRDLGVNDDMLMFTLSVELPVWRSKLHAGVREAEKMRTASDAARQAAQSRVAFDLQEAYFKLQTATRSLALYRSKLIPQAEARFAAGEAGYRMGKVTFIDLLESERFLLGAKMMVAMAEGMVGMQAARLERAIGIGE
jgi:cobalt-zinc-cadmium efflux system outer membrane protein